MLAKLAMRYHSLTFVDAKINVYRYACAVVCHVVSKAENGVLPVQLVAGKQLSLLLPSCDNPCSTSAGNRSIEQVRAKERRKRGKYNHHDAEVRAKIAKHSVGVVNITFFYSTNQFFVNIRCPDVLVHMVASDTAVIKIIHRVQILPPRFCEVQSRV